MLDLGKRIREERRVRHLSLRALAVRSGVSEGTLSRIERGKLNPTVNLTARVAASLDLNLSQLIAPRRERRRLVFRAQGESRYMDPYSGYERELLSPNFHTKGIEFLRASLPAGRSAGPFSPYEPGVEVYLTVAEGILKVRVDVDEYVLKDGESLFFQAESPHEFENRGEETCRFYLVIDYHLAR